MTEIKSYYSLKSIRETAEMQIDQLKPILEDYSQWLGALLRNPESARNNDWTKKTAELQKVLKSGNQKSSRKENNITEWVQFRDLLLCAEPLGEAEILFEAVESLKTKIDRLEKARNSLTELEKHGVGKDLVYVTYLHDGIPEKIFIRSKNEAETTKKYEYSTELSMATLSKQE